MEPRESQERQQQVERERDEILAQVEDWLETPVMILGVVWLVLIIVDLIYGLSPFLNAVMLLIWGVFILDFLVRFLLAPRKPAFLRANWLTALSLFVPALRIGRLARLARVLRPLRGARLVSLVSSFNRGMRILRGTLQTSGFGYVALLTLIITLLGAAGIYAFEGPVAGGSIDSYGEALWWTSMIMATLGSDYWPQTAEGRLLTLLLALYAFAVFGYVTATLATFFLGRQADTAANAAANTAANTVTNAAAAARTPAAGEHLASRPVLDDLRSEVAALRAEITALRGSLQSRGGEPPPARES